MKPLELQDMLDEKEECLTDCFKARKGTTDSSLCIEKCNETFNMRLEKTLVNTASELSKALKSDY